MKAKTYHQEGRLQKLEDKVRQSLAKHVYGGDVSQVDDLFARLPDFHKEHTRFQAYTRRGIEKLSREGLLEIDDIENITQSIYDRYKNMIAEGIMEIYFPHSSLMERDVRNTRNWSLGYAALLEILDRRNPLADRVAKFDEQVRILLKAYHNLFSHEKTFLRDKNKKFSTYVSAIGDVNGDREDLARIETQDSVIRNLIVEVRKHAYTTSAAVLWSFVNHARQSDADLSSSQISTLEHQRGILSRRLKELNLLQSSNGMTDFYQDGSVYDIIPAKRRR